MNTTYNFVQFKVEVYIEYRRSGMFRETLHSVESVVLPWCRCGIHVTRSWNDAVRTVLEDLYQEVNVAMPWHNHEWPLGHSPAGAY